MDARGLIDNTHVNSNTEDGIDVKWFTGYTGTKILQMISKYLGREGREWGTGDLYRRNVSLVILRV